MGKRTMNKQMAESIILAKLYKDGFIVMDEEHKKAIISMKKSKIIKHYKKSSYEDVRSILERTVKGLRMAGYEVKVRSLEGISPELEKTFDQIQGDAHALIQSALEKNELDDVSKN